MHFLTRDQPLRFWGYAVWAPCFALSGRFPLGSRIPPGCCPGLPCDCPVRGEDRNSATPKRARVARVIAAILLAGIFGDRGAAAQTADRPKAIDGFGEARRGDIPEGTAELMTSDTDKTIKNGLAWLARTQNSDGSYGAGTYRGNIAVTSLAALAFMSSGSSPGRGPYGSQIDKALVYVMDNTSPSGFIAVAASSTHGPMYSHGFGTLFLAEAYGMTHRPEIREKLQKAVRLIIDCQNVEGGWRYQPRRTDADLSVTICQINALRSGAECRVVCAQGDGRRVHAVCEAVAELGRRVPVHAPGHCDLGVSAVGGGSGGASVGGGV